jgi:predicted metal-dependent phosphoesterase TrpH
VGKADLHLHTAHSDGMASVAELLDYVQEHTDLDVIAVTDHDSLRGAMDAREKWARGSYRFEVVPGMEVTTVEGHLLALFIEEPVPCLRAVEETVAAVHRLGGLCVVPHPFTWLTRGMGLTHIRRVLSSKTDGVGFDGIEVTNGTPAGRIGAAKAKVLNSREFSLAEVGGSDAHFLACIGAGYTEFEGRTAAELRQAIVSRVTRGISVQHPSLRQIGYGQVVRQTYRGIMSTPRALGWGPTAASFVRRMFAVR